MQIKLNYRGATLVIGVLGELDHHSADYVRQKVDGEMLSARIRNIVFDFSEVSFMDSSGIGVILGRFRNIQKLNGKAAIVNANQHIRKIFEMSGIERIIPIYDSIDVAINKM